MARCRRQQSSYNSRHYSPGFLQVVGFAVLLSGTSIYNELLRSCLPAAEPHGRRRRRSADAEAALQEPLLPAQAAEEQEQQAAGRPAGSGPGVRFAEPPPASRPIAAGRQGPGGHARYTMARQVKGLCVVCTLF